MPPRPRMVTYWGDTVLGEAHVAISLRAILCASIHFSGPVPLSVRATSRFLATAGLVLTIGGVAALVLNLASVGGLGLIVAGLTAVGLANRLEFGGGR